MPNSNRQRGDYLERQTRAALRAHGWIVVRAAGSLGVADIVALRAGNTPLLVSCKVTGQVARAERLALVEAAREGGARPLLATRVNRGYVDFYSVLVEPGMRHIDSVKVPQRPGKAPPDEPET
jgi:Holliday junction resolvase